MAKAGHFQLASMVVEDRPDAMPFAAGRLAIRRMVLKVPSAVAAVARRIGVSFRDISRNANTIHWSCGYAASVGVAPGRRPVAVIGVTWVCAGHCPDLHRDCTGPLRKLFRCDERGFRGLVADLLWSLDAVPHRRRRFRELPFLRRWLIRSGAGRQPAGVQYLRGGGPLLGRPARRSRPLLLSRGPKGHRQRLGSGRSEGF